MGDFFSKRFWQIFFGILAVVMLLYFYIGRSSGLDVDISIAERKTLIQEVSVSGTVKALRKVDLAFEKSGKVGQIYVSVGDMVDRGQRLVALSAAESFAQLQEEEANVATQEAKLEELKKGTRAEELIIAETKVSNAEIALNDAKINFIDKAEDAYTKSDDAVRNRVDQFFNNPLSSNPELSFGPPDPVVGDMLEQARPVVGAELKDWKQVVDRLSIDQNLPGHSIYSKSKLNSIKLFLDNVASVINSLTATAQLSQATIDGYRSDISTARTNVNTATSNISAAEAKFRSAESSLTLARQELFLKQAGATREQISAQVARVGQAEARVKVIKAQIAKTILRSPFGGIVSRQDARIGEIVSANEPVISLISDMNFEIEAFVPEIDIARISVGDMASITLDAYGGDLEFEAEVTSIDPAETIIEGVATYKVVLNLTKEDNEIRSGMTANIDILTAKKESVIAVPARAVITKNGSKTIKILKNGEVQEMGVTTGIRSSDGQVEIIDGVEEGDQVVVFIRE